MISKEYTINLKPRPWQRARLNGKYFWDAQAEEKLEFGLLLSRLHNHSPKYTKPLALELIFYMAISKEKRFQSASPHHCKRPDLDNLCKYVMDAATGILWEDDCIVSQITTRKVYDKNPRTVLIITELE